MKKLRLAISNQDGNATILGAGIMVAFSAVLLCFVIIANSVLDQHTAQNAADLSAIAGATAATQGLVACEQTQRVSVLNDAVLIDCIQVHNDVIVETKVGKQTAKARAGPL
ncbi:pilus assembly protein TadG-related protein [Corynebacterium pseudotuberculosis]|uniref:Putative Flp pilus-assembly TadG-like N-terminal domain-containing protein n=1 Tax=Corynebacterium pseudotuberculosis 258 TaxID=1168865 RepID=A0AAU8PIS7_CORPS|nr:Rv3654c family TadE-like protein [Corynebacterium pseudotuberculosis]AER68325.1 Hypothetical protein Cp106_0216 [Corynebacterium pseudotuberculosis 1/06-A]AEQ05788.2 hypothetical protein CPCIP5297_01205 [Corynebacterium pseudotuberculosis CIP 52.97]AFB71562.1 hypothetical protein CP316_01200 [Corynebacterium pseudotuberculosis 316]AFH90064.1 hypothetical protein CP31_01420 [Corynebacterium pseudotuberculosis 31]AFK15874.1 hypothetical protein CP258_01205 [Corynebacterium pseudotuberculosis 